ncbi:MAG: outer membrane beta-barrel protein [Betaproteobacteria bacterium]|nr:outer membrane beta-barrel protein [Betaproteobacteria bacterium]
MRVLCLLACLFFGVAQARAVDGMAVEFGTSNSSNASVDMARVGVQWNWPWRWPLGSNWHVGGYWDLSLGYWDNDGRNQTHNSITDLGFTPVFRLQPSHPGAVAPYLEAAIGFHLLSHTSLSPQRRFGTKFQFGDHLGLGVRFGTRHAFDVGYRYQHLSNAGIKQPNQGIEFHQVRLQYHF